MNAVESCFTITRELLMMLNATEKADRDRLIEQILALIDKRERLLTDIQPPFSNHDQELGQKMVKMNKAIDEKLALLRQEIKRDMNGIKQKKTTVRKYANPYENLQADGVYFDKRK